MRISTQFGRTLREAPADAEGQAYRLALRAGLIRATQAGSYTLLPLGMLVVRRIEALIHAELARIEAQELRLPLIQGVAAWERTGRYEGYGPAMLRMTDRSERSLIFAPTNEEAVAELARREVTSYRQMPMLIYQIHAKYRDELRARGGLMRMREFSMMDAYSLDADQEGLDRSYARVREAFERILQRCRVSFVAVEASAGEMGGREPIEFHALSSTGEDALALCAGCGYAANVEVALIGATSDRCEAGGGVGQLPAIEEVATPGCATIAEVAAFLGVAEAATAKAVFFESPERGLIFAVVRGDRAVSEAKLCAAAGVSALTPASDAQIAAAGAVAGYASPVGLEILGDGQATTGVFVIADRSVADAGPLVAGANRAGFHLRNVVYGRDWRATVVADIAQAQADDACPRCGQPLRLERGVELGHIFKLGTRFSEQLGAMFLDRSGAERPVVMGSYGIGLERLLQIIIEQHHDDQGIIWPAEVAPLDIHLVRLGRGEAGQQAAEALYAELRAAGLGVLYDDREESPGIKFADADLIGLPLRVLISDRLAGEGAVELRPRGGEARKLGRGELLAAIRAQRPQADA